MKIQKFVYAIGKDWLARMSGPLTVPFTIAGFYVSSPAYRRLFVALAIIAMLMTGYRVWAQEYDRAEAETSKNKMPCLDGEIGRVLISIVKYTVRTNTIHEPRDSIVGVSIKAWNKVDMSPTSVKKYSLEITVDGKEFHGTQGSPFPELSNLLLSASGANVILGVNSALPALSYLRSESGYVFFYVKGLQWPGRKTKANLKVSLTDLAGKEHLISTADCPLDHESLTCY